MSRAFNAHFSEHYGADRWSTLLPALKAPTRHAVLINPFAEPAVVRSLLAKATGTLSRVPWLQVTAITTTATDGDRGYPFARPERDVFNKFAYYCMDLASMAAVEALRVVPGDSVLDMCAAPGGKSLNILFRLLGAPGADPKLAARGSLTANEPSVDRRARLVDVLHAHLPERLHGQLTVTGMNGAAFARGHRRFTKVLIDAPCSSERHVLHDAGELAKWSASRNRHASVRQQKLLWSGLAVLQAGGTLVYATCSIADAENDEVAKKVLARIAKMRKRYSRKHAARRAAADLSDDDEEDEDEGDTYDEFDEEDDAWYMHVDISVVRRKLPLGEATKLGWIVLPDTADGWGPLYFCVFRAEARAAKHV
ncbi:hypothetical protein H9P43_008998 [Blastocladiella emersonii ATCC 22665]|nr:hypothetical protein H9P43_008998 [Blastocladiella emersonii ATCC 22665]